MRDTAADPPIRDFGDRDALTGPSEALFSDSDGLYVLDLDDGSVQREASRAASFLSLSPDRELVAWSSQNITVTQLSQQDGKLIDEIEFVDRPVGFIDDETLLFRDDGLLSHDGLSISWVRGPKAGFGRYFFDDLPDGYRLVLPQHPLSADRSTVLFATGDDSLWHIQAADTTSFPSFGYDYQDLEAYTVDAGVRGCEPMWRPDGGVVCATEAGVLLLDGDLDNPRWLDAPSGIEDAVVVPVGGAVIYRDRDYALLMVLDTQTGEAVRFKAWDELNDIDLEHVTVSPDGETVLFSSARAIYRGTADGANLFAVHELTSPVRSVVW